MDRKRLETLLSAPPLGLERRDDAFYANADHPLTVFAGLPGGEPMRFTRVEAIRLDADLVAADLLGLVRDEAFTVIGIESVFAVERQQENGEREKRRTGFV